MTRLHLDYETRSSVDLPKRGLRAYAGDPTTRVLLAAWAVDDGPVRLWLPHEAPKAPPELREAMRDPAVEKWAWNASFEREITARVLGFSATNWRDTQVMALYASLPSSLAAAGAALGLPSEELKDPNGKRLIRLFSVPCDLAPTGEPRFNDWRSHPEDFETFGAYCVRDVHTERTIHRKLAPLAPPASEWELWALDQEINNRGVPVDLVFVAAAIRMAEAERGEFTQELVTTTGVVNPRTQSAFLAWAKGQGYPYNDLRRATVDLAIRSGGCPPHLAHALALRLAVAKTSTAKFQSVVSRAVGGRVYDMLQFYGASRTGRWGGRDPQPQNLPRPVGAVEGQEERVTDLVRRGDVRAIKAEFGAVLPVVSSLVRSSFRASPGHVFYAADLNAIENRVLGWLFGCHAILDVFREQRCPYLSFGVYLYRQPYDQLWHEYKVLKNKAKRQNAKPAVLGGGYMLGGGAEVVNKNGDTIKTGLWGYAESMGISMTREDAHAAVRIFREAYPEVVSGWARLKSAAFDCVQEGITVRVGPVVFNGTRGVMRVRLPSGRVLHYLNPRVEAEWREFKTETPTGVVVDRRKVWSLAYDGTDQATKKWGRVRTHGGKLTENLVQAIARDVLAEGLRRAEALGFSVVMHVHDEIVCEVPAGSPLTVADLCDAMAAPMAWAPDLPLAAEGTVSEIYKK